eukprot:TRINITY_DN1799_c0_g1_i1.p1 TRINITY_DN1799_c0_g1~~TRINITY_DN1799_c0_g1_i1.p1  ORF type:complete len:235 (-),score=54.26 TRINITY_DN1799_c0_g1_i1:128-832(-)
MLRSLVGSEMCIRDRYQRRVRGTVQIYMARAIVWIHGLGDTGAGWRGAFSSLPLSNVSFIHPDAPVAPVSVNGGARMTSWFDLKTFPVSLEEPPSPAGLEESVASIHALLAQTCTEVGDSRKVLLGGFSQGGAMSLAAGLTFDQPLAGIVSISGWTHERAERIPCGDANKNTPIMFSCGRNDPVIDFALAEKSGAELQQRLGDHVGVNHEDRNMHQPTGQEMQAVLEFMAQHLS